MLATAKRRHRCGIRTSKTAFRGVCRAATTVIRWGGGAEGIKLARAEGAEWVMHVDTDELMYPGGAPH